MTKREYNILLGQLNRIRVACNNEPVEAIRDGIMGHASACPVARTLANGVTATVSMDRTFICGVKNAEQVAKNLRRSGFKVPVVLRDNVDIYNTGLMQKFVREFDARKINLSELIQG